MKKNLQTFAFSLMAILFLTNLGFAQLIEFSNTKPNQVELTSKDDADLLWGLNWEDPSITTSGIVNTLFGGLPDPGYVVTADDFEVPEGKVWTITSIWARGFLSFDEDGEPWADADGFGVRVYADDNDTPGELIIDYLVESPMFDPAQPEIDFSTPLELTEGKYWVAVYGFFQTSEASNQGRWNQYTWNPEPPVLNKAKLRDYADLFGLADGGWQTLEDLGINVTALDFAVWGTEADDIESNTVVDIIVGSPDHTTLATAVTLAGLVETLSGEGPFTVFAPTDDAFDAIPAEVLEELLEDPEGNLTKILLYHVVDDNVLSGDLTHGQEITTLLGQILTVSIDGDDVFIVDSEGNEAQVTVPDLVADNGVVHVIDAVLMPDLTVQMFSVTFIVDMTDAVAVGDVVFDPEIHRVFLSGTFADWAQPGSDDTYELLPVENDAKNTVVIYLQDFEGLTFPPEGWAKLNPDDGSGWDIVTAGTSPRPGWTAGTVEASPAGGEQMAYCTWDTGGSSANDQWLVSPQITVEEGYELSFWMRYSIDSYDDNVDILISTTVQDNTAAFDIVVEQFEFTSESSTEWVLYTYQLEDYVDVGDQIYIAFREHVEDNFNEGSFIKIDNFQITATETIEPPTSPFYTLTLEIEEGHQEYKYFLVIDAPTWDLGEKEGTDNRVVNITADVTFDDIWGDFGVFVENIPLENSLKIFPNPVQHTLFVENSDLINDIRIFDLTGRLVYSQVVNDNTTSVNVSEFKTGVYIMQVITANGVASQKFNVR